MQVMLKIGISLRNEIFGRSVRQLLSITKWFVKLCERVYDSVSTDSKNRHLSILITRQSTVFNLLKLAMLILSIFQTLTNPKSIPSLMNRALPKFKGIHEFDLNEEIELGQKIFREYLEKEMTISIENWIKVLKEIGKMMIIEENFDKINAGQGKGGILKTNDEFMVPLDVIDEKKVQESIEKFQKIKESFPNLVNEEKLKKNRLKRSNESEEEELDLLKLIKIQPSHTRCKKCSKCGKRSMMRFKESFKKELDPSNGNRFDLVLCDLQMEFVLVYIEFQKVCICDGFWLSDF
ncbi:hypothetical protein DFH28DRAFT_973819 [Melampsora americana]|nr:hypothetical protein DFH28DRAFT_973819 [Melampsora americana]